MHSSLLLILISSVVDQIAGDCSGGRWECSPGECVLREKVRTDDRYEETEVFVVSGL